MQEKYNNVCKAYTLKQIDENKYISIWNEKMTDNNARKIISDIQYNLSTDFALSYEIMHDACNIIASKTLDKDTKKSDSLFYEDLDFFADADSNANVYTSVQLSYLSMNNEQEISGLMKDEAITSIAQACSIWYSQKVAEACEALKEYIIQE